LWAAFVRSDIFFSPRSRGTQLQAFADVVEVQAINATLTYPGQRQVEIVDGPKFVVTLPTCCPWDSLLTWCRRW
jgi:hypothetical protein